ncbi:SipW-dependent-type signal peptide-containing protein [Halobium palmae]|uniref:SipW-dependent-type signal peptide-containing protein n=1 Tax=Halobium palmae TaxID=1776492 RepID=A0ABD5S1Z2_9EURY
MADDKLNLSRRSVLAGLGTIGIASAGAGLGTSAYFNDTESISNNTVTAGELDLQLDWKNFYYGDELYTDIQPPTDNPGPMYTLDDVKPGDFGGGCISLHISDNPAYVWAGCEILSDAENGVNDPESEVDDENANGNWDGELAENIHVALLRFPLTYEEGSLESEANTVKAALQDDRLDEADLQSIQSGCTPLFYNVTLDELCEECLDGGYRLDGQGENGEFSPTTTYWYCFLWWIPMDVGNEIQSDGVEFTFELGLRSR